jgi:hypothetical protein
MCGISVSRWCFAPIRCFLPGIRERLETAGAVAKAAEACCQAGRNDQALTIALDVEQPLYEVTTYLNAARQTMPAQPDVKISHGELFTDPLGQCCSPATVMMVWPVVAGVRPRIPVNVIAPARPQMTVDELRQAHVVAARDVLRAALLKAG